VVIIARSLQRLGVRSIVAVQSDHDLSVSSRAIANVVHLGGSVTDSAQLLCMVAESEGATWVVPTSDSSIQVVCAAYENLSRICVPGCPSPHIVQRILDKPYTLDAAAQCGVPVPVSWTIEDAIGLESILPEISFPIIAKPGDKGRVSEHTFKTRTFNSAGELRSAFAQEPRFGNGLLFQTYHGGQGVGIEVLVTGGKIVAAFQHRRISENPPSGGVAVVAVSERVDPVLLDHSARLLTALEWDGVAMVEFRHDKATGEAALMEVNGRFWGSLPLAVAAGMDFPLYAWQVSQKIEPTVPPTYREGLRVRWTAGALKRFAHAFTDGPERIPKWAATRQLLADFRPGTRSAMWSWSDPKPAIQEVSAVLAGWSKETVKSLIRVAIPAPMLSIAKSARMLPFDRRGVYVRRRFARLTGREKDVALPRVVNSVLFVCHGNIMRSASAAQFLRDDLDAAGIAGVRVGSAGTHARNGRAADQRVKNAARELGANLDTHRATFLTAELVREYDVIFAMDEFNYANIVRTFPQSRGKLMLFGGMNTMGVYRPHEIADPYLTGHAEVSSTIRVVKDYVAALALALAHRRGVSTASAPAAR
jgi:protein-tyrosine-phosphatase/predicted ATP-grasp superfamily ATP-dependent carboligase